ncbi:MAG: glutathione synthase [Arenicellales bacterium]|nr:glutathione synthase [Arenicellales bacterium]
MKHAFIMDPLGGVKAYKDTTYFLMLAAESRGHTVYYLDQSDLYTVGRQVRALLQEVRVHHDIKKPFTIKSKVDTALDDLDVVWIRTDPPVDRTYIYTTLLLDLLHANVKVVNRPSSIRDWNEKLAALAYPTLTPATVVSRDKEIIREFVETNARTVLKPIDGHGGKGIIFVEPGETGLMDIIQSITVSGSHWVIAQEYLGAATEGDKRILLLNGQPLGAVLRLHAEGEELNNLDQGGTALASEITDRDREICTTLKDDLCNAGVVFAGIDIIGGMLMEINITSPTGLQEMCRFDDCAYHEEIVDSLN